MRPSAVCHRAPAPAGRNPASNRPFPEIRLAGQKAAGQALRTRTRVADLSSLHLLGMLTEDDQVRLRTALSEMTISSVAVSDAILTRDYMRGAEGGPDIGGGQGRPLAHRGRGDS